MSKEKQSQDSGRRRALKGLIGLPFAGGILIGAYAESRKRRLAKRNILEALNIEAMRPETSADMSGEPVRVGIIGFGGRGQHLVRVLGFATPSWLERMKEEEKKPTYGLHPNRQMPFFRIFQSEIYDEKEF